LSDAGWGHQKNAAFEAISWRLFFDVYIYVQKEAEILYTKNKLREGKKFLRLGHFFH